jgi:CRISPR-associated protein Cas2
LNWVQNSAFEGELSLAQLEEVKVGVRDLIKPEEDSIYFYLMRDKKWLKREVIGVEKNPVEVVL